jgi:hypothetical protein
MPWPFLFGATLFVGIAARAAGGFGGPVLAHIELFAGFFLAAGAAGFFVVEGGVAATVSLLTHETSKLGFMRN